MSTSRFLISTNVGGRSRVIPWDATAPLLLESAPGSGPAFVLESIARGDLRLRSLAGSGSSGTRALSRIIPYETARAGTLFRMDRAASMADGESIEFRIHGLHVVHASGAAASAADVVHGGFIACHSVAGGEVRRSVHRREFRAYWLGDEIFRLRSGADGLRIIRSARADADDVKFDRGTSTVHWRNHEWKFTGATAPISEHSFERDPTPIDDADFQKSAAVSLLLLLQFLSGSRGNPVPPPERHAPERPRALNVRARPKAIAPPAPASVPAPPRSINLGERKTPRVQANDRNDGARFGANDRNTDRSPHAKSDRNRGGSSRGSIRVPDLAEDIRRLVRAKAIVVDSRNGAAPITGTRGPKVVAIALRTESNVGDDSIHPFGDGQSRFENARSAVSYRGGVGRDGDASSPSRLPPSLLENVTLDAEAGLTREEVGRVIHAHVDEVRYCYESALLATGNRKLGGTLSLAFTIDTRGRVARSKVTEDTVANAALSECVRTHLSSWPFPIPAGGAPVTVQYPFLFNTLDGR